MLLMSVTQQIKVDCVIKVISVTVSSTILLAECVSCKAISSGMQCQKFLEKTRKENVIICSPVVKHVWDLNVTSNNYFNMQ